MDISVCRLYFMSSTGYVIISFWWHCRIITFYSHIFLQFTNQIMKHRKYNWKRKLWSLSHAYQYFLISIDNVFLFWNLIWFTTYTVIKYEPIATINTVIIILICAKTIYKLMNEKLSQTRKMYNFLSMVRFYALVDL